MSISSNDMSMEAVILQFENHSTSDGDESIMHAVNETEIETYDDDTTYLADPITAIPLSDESTSSEAYNQSVTYSVLKTQTEDEDEGESAADIVHYTSREQLLRAQTEETRCSLFGLVEDDEIDQDVRLFAETAAEIIGWWQIHAEDGDGNPTSHQIDFGVGSPIDLLMVLALLPERYQDMIRLDDEHRSPSRDGENLSWLHEQTTDVLLGLSINPNPASILFGQGLASMIRDEVDAGWQAFTGRSWLEDQIHLWSNNELEPDLYRFPPGTEKIVFLFNPTEVHWTVVEIELDDYVWTYTLYNSLPQGEKRPTFRACQEQFPLLEHLICRASGFAEPETREIVAAASTQQDNVYDCGPIAVYNAVELLEGRKPRTDINPEELRLRYLRLILSALYLLSEGLEMPAFRIRMRKAYLDYFDVGCGSTLIDI